MDESAYETPSPPQGDEDVRTSFWWGFLFSWGYNIIYIIITMVILYFFTAHFIAHRAERRLKNHEHLYPLDLQHISTHLLVFEDPQTPLNAYNVFLIGHVKPVYRISRLRARWWERFYLERWSLTDKTGYEFALIEYRFTAWSQGLIHFLLPKPAVVESTTVRITPSEKMLPYGSPTSDGLTAGSPISPLSDPFDPSSGCGSGGSHEDELNGFETLEYDYQSDSPLESPMIESSLIDNALINPEQLGSKVPFDPMTEVSSMETARELHNVQVKMDKSLNQCSFQLTKDGNCWMNWDYSGNLQVSKSSNYPAREVCERVGLFTMKVPENRVGYRALINTEQIDPVSALATSFLHYKNQKR